LGKLEGFQTMQDYTPSRPREFTTADGIKLWTENVKVKFSRGLKGRRSVLKSRSSS